MDWLLVPAGILLIFVGLLDVFSTVLHYDGFGFLSGRLYEWVFWMVRLLTRPLPRRYRALGLSMAAPIMVPVTITVWISLVAFGYALIYLFGMRGEASRSPYHAWSLLLSRPCTSAGPPSPLWAWATSPRRSVSTRYSPSPKRS